MAARFGRNKRRAAREAVALAQAEAELEKQRRADDAGRLSECQAAYARQRALIDEIVDRIVRAVGPDSALLPMSLKTVMQSKGPLAAREYRHVPTDLDCVAVLFDGPPPTPWVSFDEARLELLRLVVIVEDQRVAMRRLVSFENVNDHKGVSSRYFMTSWEALSKIGWRREHVEFIARAMLSLPRKQPRSDNDKAEGLAP